jgi:hypothetical protein
MMTKTARPSLLAVSLTVFVCAWTLTACKDDKKNKETDAGSDSGTSNAGHGGNGGNAGKGGSNAGTGGNGGTAGKGGTGGTGDSDAGDDAGSSTASSFHVPSSGGKFKLTTAGGDVVTFTFPASAAGKDITIESIDPKKVSWANPDFKTAFGEVIDLGPDGSTFADPILIKPSDNTSIIAFNFKDTSGVPEPLKLAADGKSFELTHFSTLALAGPIALCDSVGGWSDSDLNQACASSGAASTYRSWGAKCYRFCYVTSISCCVDPNVTTDPNEGCALGAPQLRETQTRTGTNGGQYPYCADGLPTVSSVTGTLVAGAGAQTIDLTGTFFEPGGSIYVNSQITIPTVVHSSTSATGTVPANMLTSPGTLNNIGFMNSKWDASGTCASSSLNCDFNNKSSPGLTIDIAAPAGPSCLSGGTALSNLNGSGTCADPFVIDLRSNDVGSVVYHTIGQGVGGDEGGEPASTVCSSVSATARDVAYHVLVPAGADFDVSTDSAVASDVLIIQHENDACSGPVNNCANAGGSGTCEVVAATRGNGAFAGNIAGVTVSEVSNSSAALTVRFALRGTVTMPTLTNVTTNVTHGTYAQMHVTMTGGSGLGSYAVISQSGNFEEMAYCDATDDNDCDFTLPNTIGAGTHDVRLQYTTLTGMPYSLNSLSFDVQ